MGNNRLHKYDTCFVSTPRSHAGLGLFLFPGKRILNAFGSTKYSLRTVCFRLLLDMAPTLFSTWSSELLEGLAVFNSFHFS